MAVRVQNFPKKNFGQSSISSSHFAVNCSSRWNSYDQEFPQTSFKNLCLKAESQLPLCQEAKHLGLQLQEQDSTSAQSTNQSQQEVTAIGKTNSQDQCISSESDESYGKHVGVQMKPVIFMGNPDFGINPLPVDISQPMARIPYKYPEPYCSGIFSAYGPQAIVHPQMVGVAAARVPLPLDLAEDGPIYVNAKQYHGILRRRQIRAKLEAQNKLLKTRRPYLHESRHVHALNRVRGSGGRFLSNKKHQQTDSIPPARANSASDSLHRQKGGMLEVKVHQSHAGNHDASITPRSGITQVTNSGVNFQQPDRRFSSYSYLGVPMQGNGGLMCKGTQHCTPVGR